METLPGYIRFEAFVGGGVCALGSASASAGVPGTSIFCRGSHYPDVVVHNDNNYEMFTFVVG